MRRTAALLLILTLLLSGCQPAEVVPFTPTPGNQPTAGATVQVEAVTPVNTPDLPARQYCPSQSEDATQAYQAGLVAMNSRDLVLAEDSFRKALEADPGYCDAMDYLAILLRYQGKYEESLSWSQRSTEQNANNPEPYDNLGTVAHYLERYDEAASAFETLMRLKPQDGRGPYGLARAVLAQGDLDRSLSLAQEAEKLFANETPLHKLDVMVLLGVIHYRREEYSEAKRYLVPIIKLAKEVPYLSYILGVSYLYDSPPDAAQAQTYIEQAREAGYTDIDPQVETDLAEALDQ